MEIITKNGIILGEEDRNAEAMAAFIFDRLISSLKLTKELFMSVYLLFGNDMLSSLKKKYIELLSEEDASGMCDTVDIIYIQQAVVEKYGKEEGESKVFDTFYSCWKDYLKRYEGVIPYKFAESVLERNFKLSKLEMDLLKIVYTEHKITAVNFFLSELTYSQYREVAAIILDADGSNVYEILGETGSLAGKGLIVFRDFLYPYVSLKEFLLPVFSGETKIDLPISLVKPKNQKTFPLESFPLKKDEVSIIHKLFLNPEPVNLLVYGSPGTGKSAFAHSLAKNVNRPLYTFDMLESGAGYMERPFFILSSLKHLPYNAVLLIDEADRLLKSEGRDGAMDKGWLVTFLDNTSVSTIWIVNDLADIHDAVKRRFVYNIEFIRWSVEARMGLWENLVGLSPLSKVLPAERSGDFARKYQMDAGNISSAIEIVSSLYKSGSIEKDEVEGTLEQILSDQHILISGRKDAAGSVRQIPYDPGMINSDYDIIKLKDTIAGFIRTPAFKRVSGINILFWGEPGTGKTAAVRYIGEELGLNINEKKASELIDPLVGATGKNIREFFKGITGDNQIALLDEADSFIIDRASARNSWERFQTNELLTQMENHRGILFCCTNDLESMDRAVLRRFTWKIEFSPMKAEDILELFKKYFPVKDEELSYAAERLDRLDGITPGDFGILWRRYKTSGCGVPEIADILDDLEIESDYRKSSGTVIGFR